MNPVVGFWIYISPPLRVLLPVASTSTTAAAAPYKLYRQMIKYLLNKPACLGNLEHTASTRPYHHPRLSVHRGGIDEVRDLGFDWSLIRGVP